MNTVVMILWGGFASFLVLAPITLAFGFAGPATSGYTLPVYMSAALVAGMWWHFRQYFLGLGFWQDFVEGWVAGSAVALLCGLTGFALWSGTFLIALDSAIGGGFPVLVGGWLYGVIPIFAPLWMWSLRWAAGHLDATLR